MFSYCKIFAIGKTKLKMKNESPKIFGEDLITFIIQPTTNTKYVY